MMLKHTHTHTHTLLRLMAGCAARKEDSLNPPEDSPVIVVHFPRLLSAWRMAASHFWSLAGLGVCLLDACCTNSCCTQHSMTEMPAFLHPRLLFYSNVMVLFKASAVIWGPLCSSPLHSCPVLSCPLLSSPNEGFLLSPTTTHRSLHRGKFFELPCWVRATEPPPTKMGKEHFKLALQAPSFLCLAGMNNFAFFHRHLCGGGNHSGSDPGSLSARCTG